MHRFSVALLFVFFFLFLGPSRAVISSYSDLNGQPYSVSYTRRSLLFNGEPVLLTSGDMQYTRNTPGMWPGLFQKARAMGLNTLQTYVFWNKHERQPGVYDFSGQLDLVAYIQAAAKANLFVNLRIGPFIDAEWKYGGLPVWLRDIPNLRTRTSNDAWKHVMAQWVTYVVELTRPYFATNGGPIYILQIENEFFYSDPAYIQWCGDLAASLNAGIPWEMCNGAYANNTILTCNNCDCSAWIETKWQVQPDTPAMQTESAGWFEMWGMIAEYRPAQAWANAQARFFALGGSAHNNYMFHGGNNYGGWGGASIATEYEFDVPLYSNGTTHEPKFSLLGRLNRVLQKNAATLFSQFPNPKPLLVWDGSRYVPDRSGNFTSVAYDTVTFLISNATTTSQMVQFNNKNYLLVPLSTVILTPDELWNSSDIYSLSYPTKKRYADSVPLTSWHSWNDLRARPAFDPIFISSRPIEQITLTNDTSDYLYYTTTIDVASSGTYELIIDSTSSNGFSIYLDDQLLTEVNDHGGSTGPLVLKTNLQLPKGQHNLTLLSVSLGIVPFTLFNVTPWDIVVKGINGSITLGTRDLTNQKWIQYPTLAGELLQLYTAEGSKQVTWTSVSKNSPSEPGSWLQSTFVLSPQTLGNRTLMVNVTGMSRGYAYVNGFNLGRYWTLPSIVPWTRQCSPPAVRFPTPNGNSPVQTEYHIPPDVLLENGPNLLTLFDELGGNPSAVYLVMYDDPIYNVV